MGSFFAKAAFGLSASIAVMANNAHGGTWGNENWGQMYWGDYQVTAPISAPQIEAIWVDDNSIRFEMSEYGPGEDGWSTIQSYIVSCEDNPSQTSTSTTVQVTGLTEATAYTCQIIAINAAGQSTPLVQQVVTEALRQSLPVWLLHEISKRDL